MVEEDDILQEEVIIDDKPVMLTKEEVMDRRLRIAQLRNRGMSVKDIADAESVSIATVSRDLHAAKRDNIQDIKNFNREGFTADVITGYDDVWMASWKIHDGTKDPELKLKALNLCRQTLNDKRKMAQDYNLVKKDLQVGGLNINIDLVAGMTEESVRQLAAKLIETDSLSAQLALPELDPNAEVIDIEEVKNDNSDVPTVQP